MLLPEFPAHVQRVMLPLDLETKDALPKKDSRWLWDQGNSRLDQTPRFPQVRTCSDASAGDLEPPPADHSKNLPALWSSDLRLLDSADLNSSLRPNS